MPELIPSSVIDDVVLVRPDVHGDERGRFVETYRRSWFPLGREMVQGNRSEKQAGALVGLHYHLHQADYWYALRGRARVVLHDLRRGRRPTARRSHRYRRPHRPGESSSRPAWPTASPRTPIDPAAYLVDSYYNPGRARAGLGRPRGRRRLGDHDPILSERDQANPRRATSPTTSGPAWPADGPRRTVARAAPPPWGGRGPSRPADPVEYGAVLVGVVIGVVVIVGVVAFVVFRRRSHDDVHSVEGYHRQLHTLEEIRTHTPSAARRASTATRRSRPAPSPSGFVDIRLTEAGKVVVPPVPPPPVPNPAEPVTFDDAGAEAAPRRRRP